MFYNIYLQLMKKSESNFEQKSKEYMSENKDTEETTVIIIKINNKKKFFSRFI